MHLLNWPKLPVPDEVNVAYKTGNLRFGRDYIIPKPMDPRLIEHVAPAVAKAAIETGVARQAQNRLGCISRMIFANAWVLATR
jgi:malate dehydrogenase (oxaloacetate-decarboxylating)(NADP+)